MTLMEIMRRAFGLGGAPAGATDGGAAPATSISSTSSEAGKMDVPVAAVGDARVTAGLLAQLGVAAKDAVAWAGPVDAACQRFQITTRKRLAMFLANILHETGMLTRWEENLNYSVGGLLNGFGRHRISADDAQRLGRKAGQADLTRAQQNAIADVIYGGEWGRLNLGNVAPHDGSDCKGRGLIQATGRAMYERLAAAFGFGDVSVVRDWLMTRDGAALSAAWIWAVEKRCNPLADAGDIRGARKKINGGDKGLAEVTALNARALAALS